MTKAIYFDMDGTIADFYGVEGWLDALEARHTRPYREAKTLIDSRDFGRVLRNLQKVGYVVGIVSWSSKTADDSFTARIEKAKRNWLARHIGSVEWDEIHVIPYGTPKGEVVNHPDGILFDDEARNRNAWRGVAYSERHIMKHLSELLSVEG